MKKMEKSKETEQTAYLPFIRDVEVPVLEHANKMSKHIHFILQGSVHVMNSNGLYDYGMIQEGGYFGDISAMLGVPEEFSYLYNQNSEKPLLILEIPTVIFLKILEKFPGVKDTLTVRAHKRLETFRNFKQIELMRYMKFIMSNPTYLKPKEQ